MRRHASRHLCAAAAGTTGTLARMDACSSTAPAGILHYLPACWWASFTDAGNICSCSRCARRRLLPVWNARATASVLRCISLCLLFEQASWRAGTRRACGHCAAFAAWRFLRRSGPRGQQQLCNERDANWRAGAHAGRDRFHALVLWEWQRLYRNAAHLRLSNSIFVEGS